MHMPSAGSVFGSVGDLLRQKTTFIIIAVLCSGNVSAGSLGSTSLAGLSLGHLEFRDHHDNQPTVSDGEAVDDNKVR